MTFGIYFSDGSMVSSEHCTPQAIDPRAGVQVIIQDNPDHGWDSLSGYDYYVWDARGDEVKWWGCDRFGLHHYWLQPGWKCILFGTMIDKKTFREIFDRARSEFGVKTAFNNYERKP